MKRQFTAFALCVLIFLMVPLSVFAAEPPVVDKAGLLDATEKNILTEMCEDIRLAYGFDLVFLTVPSLEGATARSYADDYYDFHSYSPDGILFLVAMAEREWHISTSGAAIDALSDEDLEILGDYVAMFLSDGDFYGAFFAFADEAPRYFGTGKAIRINWFLSLGIGAAIAGIVLLILRGLMNTRTPQHSASDYQSADSFRLKVNQDLFLFSQVSKVRRQQPQQSGSRGGSTVHRSSSGRSHGGRGGKF